MNRWRLAYIVGTLIVFPILLRWIRTSAAEQITRDPPKWTARGKERKWSKWRRRGL